jgi:sarcosine oxidase subunit alpha
MENGFLHLGADTNGTTIPADVGWGRVARALRWQTLADTPENLRADRLQLVGLPGRGPSELPAGSHLRLPGSSEPTDGWIVGRSPHPR